jgi:hypothetical protein
MPGIAPPPFFIGVFSQPIGSFAKWKARGINTLVSHEPEGGRVKKSDWEAAATTAGFFFMDYPADDDPTLQLEAQQPNRLAFMQDDEPDLTRTPNTDRTNADGWTKPELLAARYARCKAAAPNLPVFVNFAGTAVTPDAYPGNKHLPYIAAADWLCHDWYVKNKNWQRYPIDLIGKAMDRLALWSDNKPQFAFIECSDQKISPLGRPPTPDEVEQEVNLAVAKGARGIIYFPQKPPPGFQYDAMSPDIVDRITHINARLAATPLPTPPTPSTPPRPNEPTLTDVVNQIQTLTARVELLSKSLDTYTRQRFRASIDLSPLESGS